MSYSTMPGLTAPPPHLVAPTSLTNHYMSTLMRMAGERGYYPAVLPVPSDDLAALIKELASLPQYPLTGSNHYSRVTICGVPIIHIPFIDDPLYKQLQSYATLAGLEITYPGISRNTTKGKLCVPFATCFSNGYGWRFTWGRYTPDRRSYLDEISTPFSDPIYPPPYEAPQCSPLQSVTVRIR